jgi:hypothetical protein
VRGDSSIGSRGARRLLKAAPPANAREERVAAVLSALAPQDATDAAVPEAVLAAFAAHTHPDQVREAVPGPGKRSGARAGRVGRAAAVKAGVVVLAVSSGTVAAAAADVLPAPAQRAAHSLFGSWGVPAPRTSPGAGMVSPSAPAAGTPVTSAPDGGSTQSNAAHPGVTPSMGRDCSVANTHAAGVHCTASATAGTAPAASDTGHATKNAGNGHTASPHSSAAH